MNKINPKKLFHSKWTAVKPNIKEKHFIVTFVDYGENGEVLSCCIEAIMSKKQIMIEWSDLKKKRYLASRLEISHES